MAAVSARARVHSVVVTMRAASARESTSVTTKADSILPRSKRREGVLSAGGSKRNDGAHHITASLLEPVPWTLSTTGGSWVSFGGPARSLLLGRCVPLLGRSVPRNAVQPRMALHIIINSGSWAHLALRLTRFDGGVVAVLHGAEPGRRRVGTARSFVITGARRCPERDEKAGNSDVAPFSSAELRVETAYILLSPLCLAAGVHAGLNKRGVARFRLVAFLRRARP